MQWLTSESKANFQMCCETQISYLFSNIRHDTVLRAQNRISLVRVGETTCPVSAVQLYRSQYPIGPLFPSVGPLIPFPVSCESCISYECSPISRSSADLFQIYTFFSKRTEQLL